MEARNHTAIAGLQWGDEGKGKVVDHLATGFDLVVRYNGGANAGHTVVAEGERYALHLVPCGVLHGGKMSVIGNGVVVDPVVLTEEIDMLRSRGVSVGDNLVVSDRAHVVMPYHKTADVLQEAAVAALAGKKRAIGTTARGIGPCYADKCARSTAVRVGDLLDPDRLADRLRSIVRLKNASLAPLADIAGQPFVPFDPDLLAESCREHAERLRTHVRDTGHLVREAMRAGRAVLFEGANGFMLDVDHGTYPYVTSSNASVLGLYPGAGVPGRAVSEIVGVVKAYTSRVGAGPFPTEQDNATGERIRERGREYGTTTGRPRRCGWLDLVAVRYAAETCGATALAVTLLDVLAGLGELAICTGYTLGGRSLAGFPASDDEVAAVVPTYTELDGFREEIGECRTFGDLPGQARRYIETIEGHVGLPVRLVGVGPSREQTIVRAPG